MTSTFRPLVALIATALALGASSTALGAATIVIANTVDAPGVGFNDTTVVAPVGGNTGTTLGQQRLIAFQAAAAKWGATLDSSVTITVRAQWTALTCTATSAVLGSAGAIQIFRNFTNAPFADTWYGGALANKIAAADQNPAPATNNEEINANFNVNLGSPTCLAGSPFYLGLDANHGTGIDLVTVLTHEFAHGLGFQTFTSGTTGAQNAGFPSVYDRFLVDLSSGKSWLQMTDAERAASAINARKLAWDGPQVLADAPSVLSLGTAQMVVNSPAGIAGQYDVGTASFGAQLTAGGLTGNVVLAIDPNDVAGPSVNDGCSALTNAAAIAGNIALIDRGTCGFAVKALNAQNAGAIGMIVVDNVAGGPPAGLGGTDPAVTIPAVRITLADGNSIKGQLGVGVNVTLKLDLNVRAGADPFGKPLVFTPNPFQSGSSVSHWDTSTFPNQLMEPAINDDLTHEVTPPNDLTFSQMRDIGWVASVIPSAITKTAGDTQETPLNVSFGTTPTVTTTAGASGIAVTWTTNPNAKGAGATFASTGTRFAVTNTDGSGMAVAPVLTANGQSGAYFMNATSPGAGTTTFALLNASASLTGSACITDTNLQDFQNGIAAGGVSVNAIPDAVTLVNVPTVNQQNLSLSGSGVGINTAVWGGQTFTPTVSGQLTRADINIFCSGCTGTAPNLLLSVRATSGNLPTGADLATATVTGSNSGASAYLSGTFGSPLTVTAGTVYALLVRPATNPSVGTYALTRSASDVYAGGQRVSSSDTGATWTAPLTSGATTDAGFLVYVLPTSVSGNLISGLKDANAPSPTNTLWTTLTWNASVPANTSLQFQVAASDNFIGPFNFVGPDGTAATFFANGASLAQFNGKRFLKTKAFLATTDTAFAPVLSDVTACYDNVVPPPDLTVTKSHTGNFTQGQVGATYTVTVNNVSAVSKPAATSVSVTDTAPAGITVIAMAGTGWACTSLPTCTRSDALAGGASYPPITVTVAVAGNATSPLINSVSVSTAAAESNTGNNTATDSTIIVAGAQGSVTVSRLGSGTGSVTSLDGGVNCGVVCSQTYAVGSPILLTASASGGSTFTGWLGACTGTGTCLVTVNGASTVQATFAQSAVVGARILDIDANNAYDGATDGVLVLRHLFGLSGSALSNGAIGTGATPARVADPALHNYLLDIAPYLDVDGNGRVDALTDGLLIIRALLGLTELTGLTQNAIGPGATRTAGQIEAYIQTLKPP